MAISVNGIPFAMDNSASVISGAEASVQQKPFGDIGSYDKWSTIEIALLGPASSAEGTPNPFQVEVTTVFTSPQGVTFDVPAFYDGDGKGGLNGNVWRVRFTPDTDGLWSFQTLSTEPALAGYSGTFNVTTPAACASYVYEPGSLPDLSCMGPLQYVGGHYLKFADGPYWSKGGIDDPENFLGNAFGDWAAKREAVDYLSSMGVNSIYLLTNNIAPGDGNDTWPWLGDTASEAKANSDRFNIPLLQEWEDFFSYVQSKGLVLHIVLDDDSAWHGYDHDLYYREMIARFGHHPGIIWNVGEEADENYSNRQQIQLAEQLRDIDAYQHPITIHRKSPWPFLGNENFDLTSIQIGGGANDFTLADLDDYNAVVISHREESADAGRPIAIMIDETPRVTLVNEAMRKKLRSEVLYPIFLGGGGFELHFQDQYTQSGSLSIWDLDPMLREMTIARKVLESLPFHEMEPCNDLLSITGQYCLGKTGEAYAVYAPSGGTVVVDLTAAALPLTARWIDPVTGIESALVPVPGVGSLELTSPLDDDSLLVIERVLDEPTALPSPALTDTPNPSPDVTPSPAPSVTQSPSTTMGDVNCDGKVGEDDANLVLQYDAGLMSGVDTCPLPPEALYLPTCDVNVDAECDVVDGLLVLQDSMGLRSVLSTEVMLTTPVPEMTADNQEMQNSVRSTEADQLGSLERNDLVEVSISTVDSESAFGALAIELRYAPEALAPIDCVADPEDAVDLSTCNPDYESHGSLGDVVRTNYVAVSGISGDVKLADLEFLVVGQPEDGDLFEASVVRMSDEHGNLLPLDSVDLEINMTYGTEFTESGLLPFMMR